MIYQLSQPGIPVGSFWSMTPGGPEKGSGVNTIYAECQAQGLQA